MIWDDPQIQSCHVSYDMKKEWRDLSSANPQKTSYFAAGLDGIGLHWRKPCHRSNLILVSCVTEATFYRRN